MIEVQVELEDVDTGFAEEAELAAFGVTDDELADGGFGEVALVGDAGDLEVSGGGCDVGIKARSGSGDEVDGDVGVGVILLECGDVSRYAVDEFFVGGCVVEAAGVGGVITCACVGWA